jgi:hypothetical protein
VRMSTHAESIDMTSFFLFLVCSPAVIGETAAVQFRHAVS